MEGLALSVGVAGAMTLLRFIGDWIILGLGSSKYLGRME